MSLAEPDPHIYGIPKSENNAELLRVKVSRGVELMKKDIFGVSDPYAVVTLHRKGVVVDKAQTKTIKKVHVSCLIFFYNRSFICNRRPLYYFSAFWSLRNRVIKNTRYPIWNEEFIFRVTRRDCLLSVKIFDENRITRDDFLGMIEIQLSHANITRERSGLPIAEESYVLRPRSARSRVYGSVFLSLSWISTNHGSSPSESSSSGGDDWELLNTSTGESNSSCTQQQQQTVQAEQAQPSSPLPPGWEERQDANGRTFYLNHNAQTTQWERPTLTLMSDRLQIITEFYLNFSTDAAIIESEREDVDRRRNYDSRWQASSDMNLQINMAELDAGLRMNFAGEGHVEDSVDDGVGPLPRGWDMQVAPNGRKFFIDHINKTTTWTDPRNGRVSALTTIGRSSDELGELPAGWEERVHTDGRVFFIDHNTRRTQWEDPRFENASIAGPAVPYSRDYKCKYEYLRLHLPKSSGNSKCELNVRRTHLFEDSYRQIMQLSASQLRAKLWIEFDGETGLDYGGVAREWFYLLSHHIFNPYYGLFEYSATDNYTLQINPHSETCNPEHISYFHFIGRVIGIAIFHGKLLDAFFIRPFYKMMLGKPITLNDMESVDNEYFNSLIYIKDNDPEDLDLYFAVDEQFYGQTQTVELREGGEKEKVTEENKDEYIDLVIKWRFVSRVEAQMKALMKGVHELIPSNLLSIFDPNELELLVCGLQKIDVKDWKDNTLYKGGYAPNHAVIHNFWKCILSFDNEMRARVLQFVTGTSRVPMNGFRELYGSNGPQKFTIEKWGNPDMLPRAHTCFNRMDLPPYGSFHELREKLTVAIENSEIFSGVD
ncbi:unnamed protein product [Anisakis simplex]|uniref:E3 ubiquitin-protein ligase n=1 Tax=Anisakis simplex TaxID=6269 RepID=A0A0M3JVI0_ANISI|nr:unnamed protein product [Anisakis simplex]